MYFHRVYTKRKQNNSHVLRKDGKKIYFNNMSQLTKLGRIREDLLENRRLIGWCPNWEILEPIFHTICRNTVENENLLN